jgi:dephospho-CoA kinase
MLRVGITGEMGSGKTFIANLFAGKGVPVYNCDRAAKELTANDPELILQIKKHFGENIYEGNVFKNLSDIVFASDGKDNLKILADLIHPHIYTDIDKFVETNSGNKTGFCLIESAILYENGMDKKLDAVIYVSSPEKTRKKRAMDRDKITEIEYDNRMKNQISSTTKIHKSNYIVYNTLTDNIGKRVEDIYNSLQWTIHCKERGEEIYY